MNANNLDFLRIKTPPATLREIALDRMRRAIISGLFEPGERLVERTLCDQLGVSRSVIREVIRHLEAEGLIEMLAKQGPVVATLSWEDARQIYEIRAMLESKAVADCARLADAEVKASLTLAFRSLEEASQGDKPMDVIDATTDFYKIIFQAGNNQIAWGIVTRLNSRISRLRVMTLSTSGRMRSGPVQLRRIFEAIEAGDPQAAAAACRTHVAAASDIAKGLLSRAATMPA
ncbi:DNA-binding FadR family transcriptional regulator OS=Castellaniella defragrans OX=75697 GN=HNR28_000953 PE=4 SV=1 [Castellaniella defragrans]